MSDEAPCRLLEWDSQFFGARVARVTGAHLTAAHAERLIRWCTERRVDCVYFLCRPDDDESVTVAEEHGFHLVDVRIELDWCVHPVSGAAPDTVRRFEDTDLAAVQHIAATTYTDTRFYYDQRFTTEQAAALYREWITKSARGEADVVFIAVHRGNVGGFISCHSEERNVGRIGLVGVRGDARGCGYGGKLVQAAQGYFFERGISTVRVVTLGRNLAAQRLYQANGFRSRALSLWYHKWFR